MILYTMLQELSQLMNSELWVIILEFYAFVSPTTSCSGPHRKVRQCFKHSQFLYNDALERPYGGQYALE